MSYHTDPLQLDTLSLLASAMLLVAWSCGPALAQIAFDDVTSSAGIGVNATESFGEALALVDIRILDHLVVAGGEVIRFAENGLL